MEGNEEQALSTEINHAHGTFDITVPERLGGKRADVALTEMLSGLSRARVSRLISSGDIVIEGQTIKPSRPLAGGETVSVTIPEPTPIGIEPEDLPLDIVHEDSDIVVVNKPPGMTVHPGAGARSGTLVNALLARCTGLSGIGGTERPGIVHRLDKDTSGIMVVAKHDRAHQALAAQFEAREVEKTYLALVLGSVKGDSGTVDSPIGRHPTERVKMSTRARRSRQSLTEWRVVERFPGASLVEARPRTGRTHQIRVHMKEMGHPILGDTVYGGAKSSVKAIAEISKKLGRQALHASKLTFVHPTSGTSMSFDAPLPQDMQSALNSLRELT